jgi:hypothetical protein
MRNPRLSAAMVEQLQKAARKLARGASKLSTDEICDVYWVLARASGFRKNTQVVFSSMIGRMRAAYNAGCGDGVLTMIGYGEYGLTTSIALYQSIIELRKVVQQRAAEEFGDLADGAEPDSSAEPSPEPSESASATTGSADETE